MYGRRQANSSISCWPNRKASLGQETEQILPVVVDWCCVDLAEQTNRLLASRGAGFDQEEEQRLPLASQLALCEV